MPRRLWIQSVLLLVGIWALPCRACDVPVFRYALERWIPATYDLNVLVPEGRSAADAQSMPSLQSLLDSANCTIQYVSSKSPGLESAPPQTELVYSNWRGEKIKIWSGQASAENVDKLVDSPARRALARQILDGATAVWVFLECEDKPKNASAQGRLEMVLAQMERELSLPESVARLKGSMKGDLRVDFPIIRVPSSSEQEKILVSMLVRSEPDLESYRSEPMAFPVFGRGRVLYALVGEGIDSANVAGACAFLAGPCACEIKDSNPGIDLLIKAGWASALGESWVDASENVSLSSLAALAGNKPDESTGGAFLRSVVISLLIVMLLVGAGSAVLLRKLKKGTR